MRIEAAHSGGWRVQETTQKGLKMISLRNILIVFASAGMLAACAGPDIGALQKMPSKGTTFDKALQIGYTELAKIESEEYDTRSADHFAAKAKLAANGENVEPDRVSDFDVPKKYHAELEAARKRLVAARATLARRKAPEALGEAQTRYDCWLEEASEDIQPADISQCYIGFNAAMAEVATAMKPVAKAAPIEKKAPSKETHVIYFSFNSAKLTQVAKRIVAEAAASIEKSSKAVFVIGNTDTSGSASYNRELADRRAETVIRQLRADGVKGPISKIVAGEGNPAKKTGDGVREPLNRRVEIAITR